MAVPYWYDPQKISNAEVRGLVADCCVRGPGGPAHDGPDAHKGPGEPTRARPATAPSGPQGPGWAHKSPGGPTRARPTRGQVGHQGPGPQEPKGAHKGPRAPTRARPTRDWGSPQAPRRAPKRPTNAQGGTVYICWEEINWRDRPNQVRNLAPPNMLGSFLRLCFHIS